MAQQKANYYQTPLGRGRYVWLSKPDTKYKSDGVYKTELICSPDDAKDLITQLAETQSKTNWQFSDVKLPYSTDDETGDVVFSLSSNFEPKFFDSQGHIIEPSKLPSLFAGTRMRIAGTITTYDVGGNVGSGIKLNIGRVQVVEAVSGGAGGFDAVEGGYVADEEETFEAQPQQAQPSKVETAEDAINY